MIDIIRYREYLIELQHAVNEQSEKKIDEIVMATKEGHLTKKLKDKAGLLLCANYPDSSFKGNADTHTEKNQVLFFLLEKVSSGSEDNEAEIQHYAEIQRVMQILKDELQQRSPCGSIDADEDMITEWEYDIFGGYNGLSLGAKLKDYD
jgi:hypothetical protein